MQARATAFAGVVVTLLAAACAERPAPATQVFTNGNIYTLAGPAPERVENEPHVSALAVRDGRIVAAGSAQAMGRYVGDATQVVDLGGRTAVPGLVDAHVHVQGLGRALSQVDLVGTRSYDEVIERVQSGAAALPAGEWVQGRGWDQNDWPDTAFPEHEKLSGAVPDHPVYLRRVDGHAALLNATALRLAGIDAATRDPAGGRILRRADGKPTGVLVDRAMDLVTPKIPAPDPAERQRRLRLALAHAAALGLTGLHDAGIQAEDFDDYRLLLEQGELRLRVYALLDGTPEPGSATDSLLQLLCRDGGHPFDPSGHLALRAVKLYADGALGSRGAALLAPYSDEPGTLGLPQHDAAAFLELARPLHAAGLQLATHAIGDAANRMVLDTYETLQRELPRPDCRHRVEHAQVLAPADIPRFAALGVLPSMQPTHCTSDMPWAGARLGPEREKGAYAWRSLRATGAMIVAGSDAPVESLDPLLGLYAAVTREDTSGDPAGGWHAEQRLSRSEALRAFTAWAAYASFTESEGGTLETGKRADLSVFDRDLLRVEPRELLQARAMLTVVGGEIVYERRE